MRAIVVAVGAVLGFYSVATVPVFAALALTPPEWWEGLVGLSLQSCVLFVGAVTASALFVGRGWASLEMLGCRRFEQSARGFGMGLGVGLLMAGVAIAFAVLVGGARVSTGEGAFGSYLLRVLGVGLVLLVAAFTEELLFRGYPLSRLAEAVGKVRASLGLAAVFLLAHSLNPEATAFGLVNIGLAALVLSAAFFGPGGLAAAWGLHVGWNGGIGIIVDAPVSGVNLEMPMVDFSSGGPSWFTGGSFGPEGGLVSTVAMAAVLLWLLHNTKVLQKG
jgi:membrane protease YdiL (CAAX protease family)